MKKLFSFFLVIIFVLSSLNFMNTAKADENPTISIKLKNYIGNQNQLSISVKGEYDIFDSSISLQEGKTYTVKVENNALSLYENGLFLANFASLLATPKEYGTNNYILINNRPYLGSINFVIEQNTFVRPINTLPIEDYLKGVVPYEMMGSWNKEALKAQAVAARTYATRYKVLDMDDTIMYQAYGGYSWNPNSTSAVDETKYQTLTYNGRLIDAFYSASNGGMTESNANVWGGTPLDIFPIKADPYDTKVSWGFILKKTQIDTTSLDFANPDNWWNSVKEADPTLIANIKEWMAQNGYSNNEIKIVSIPELSFSPELTTGGRVKYGTITLQFFLKDKTTGNYVMDNNNQIKMNTLTFANTNASKIRAMIGLNTIKSYLVTSYTKDDASYTVEGLGNGHGVGMSQWGAKSMADKGFTYKDILSFYYTGATLTNTASAAKNVTVNKTVIVPKISAVTDKSTAITGTGEPYTGLTINVGSKKIGSGIIDWKGNFRLSIPKEKAGTNLSVIAKDRSGNITSIVIKVLDKTAPVKPRVNIVTYKDVSVSGATEAKATLTIKAGSKLLGTGKADSKGKFRLSIRRQRIGTTLSVTSKDGAGNVSAATILKVKARR